MNPFILMSMARGKPAVSHNSSGSIEVPGQNHRLFTIKTNVIANPTLDVG